MRQRYSIQILLVLACLLGPGTKYAQIGDYHLQLFDFNYGVKPGTILSLCKDKQDFLWILYSSSAQRFDGSEITTYKFPKGQVSIICDEAGRVWVNSPTAIFLFNKTTLAFDEIPLKANTDKRYHIGPVFTLPGNKTWTVTTLGFFEYNDKLHEFEPVREEIPIKPPYRPGTLKTIGNNIFIANFAHIFRYDLLKKQVDSLPTEHLRRFYPLSRDSLLMASWNLTSYWYDFGQKTINAAKVPDSTKIRLDAPWSVRSVAKVAPYHYIMGSQEGLFLYEQHIKSFLEVRLLHKGKRVYVNELTDNIFMDKEGYVWVATIDGVGRFSLLAPSFGLMRNKQLYDDMPSGIDNIRQIASDGMGTLWISTGFGFIKWDWKANERKFYFPKFGSDAQLAYPSVRGLVYDGRYLIVGPSDLGVWLFDTKTEKYRRPRYADEVTRIANQKDFVDYICRMKNGNMLIICRDHIYHMDGKTYEISILDTPFENENPNSALQDKNGLVWVTTNAGMYLLDSNLHYLTKIKFLTDKTVVNGWTLMRDNSILFSVDDGVYTANYFGDTVIIKKFSPYFDDIPVNILVEDRQNIIWAASENGIYRYDPESDRFNLFDDIDNVQGFGFNLNSWYMTPGGMLFLGGTNGLNYFKPEGMRASDGTLNLFIHRVSGGKSDSTHYPLDQVANLPWSQRSLVVDFVCPYYNNADKVKYRYVLEGLDDEWKYIGNTNQLRFTSLSPGDYTLKIEASINNADWIPSKNTFSFKIRYPFWMTWWFYTLLVGSIVGSIWAFEKGRNKRIKEKQEELDAQLAINYFSNQMMQNQSVDDMLWDVAKNCIGQLQFEDCVIYQLDEERGILYQSAALGPKSPERYKIVDPLEIPVGEGICGYVALTGVGEIIDDTTQDPRYITDDQRRYSEITVPIVSGGKVLGIIDCEHSKKGFFTQRHLSILSTIASLCAAKMVKAKAEAEKSHTEQILMETKQQMADIEMQALRAQMNPHFIFNCLNSINRYIVKSDQATASLYLTRFAKLIRLILDNSNSKTVTLTNELDALRLYIDMEGIRFEKQFSYAIKVDDDVAADHIYVPPLIIQPYVENAIWHGLLHKETEGHLVVNLSMPLDNLLECVIEDNGVGRAKAKELKSKSASHSKSLGMKLTESRLALLNKHSNWGAAVEILDLVDPEGVPAGTRVTLRIPIDS